FFSSRRRHTRSKRDWSSDVCSSDLQLLSCGGCGTTAVDNVQYIHRPYRCGVDISTISMQCVVDSRYDGGRSPDRAAFAHSLSAEVGRAACRESALVGVAAGAVT